MPDHVPVLLSAVLTELHLTANDKVIDATLGGGGHAAAILDAIGPGGRLLGIEADPRTLRGTTEVLAANGSRVITVQGNFRTIERLANDHGFHQVAAVLFDLGVSSMTLADARRGFSWQADGPLDMRFDPDHQSLTAADIVNHWLPSELAHLLRTLGEEHMAGPITQLLVNRRMDQPWRTTGELAEAIAQVKHRRGRRHPATQTFQALRMAVNDELGALREALPPALALLRPGGRLAVISFHSLEDRLVKQWSKDQARQGRLTLVNKHVIVPARPEQITNPRSRSAKLRVMQKI